MFLVTDFSIFLSRKRKGGIKLDEQSVETNEEEPGGERNTELAGQIKQETKELKENKEKKRADDLWASFISDVKPPPKKPSSTASLSLVSIIHDMKTKSPSIPILGRMVGLNKVSF